MQLSNSLKHRWLGWLALVFCALLLSVWIPLDVETGIIEKVRRQVTLGDAFAPTVAAMLIGLGGLLILLERNPRSPDSTPGSRHPDDESVTEPSSQSPQLNIADLTHAGVILLLVTISLLLMRYAGPLVLSLFHGADVEYRLLRDTAPWKYIGYTAGGLWLIVTMIALAERRLRWQHFLIALSAVLLLIAFYDLPFDDLLLPPNGDV